MTARLKPRAAAIDAGTAGQKATSPLDRQVASVYDVIRGPPAVFKTSRAEALTMARRLMRGFSSAPDPRRQIQQIHSALVHGQDWPPEQKASILAFGTWLGDRPSLGELKPRCEALLAGLD
jgi:hypothetical protein